MTNMLSLTNEEENNLWAAIRRYNTSITVLEKENAATQLKILIEKFISVRLTSSEHTSLEAETTSLIGSDGLRNLIRTLAREEARLLFLDLIREKKHYDDIPF